jgi:hypothetical protein
MAQGRPKNIESPEKLKEYFLLYQEETKKNPFIVKDWVGKDATDVYREKERPLTIDGFECWLSENGIIEDLGDYLKNKDNRYEDFAPICSYIKKKTRKDQIEGGMAGIYNPSITQRLNNINDGIDLTTKGKEINTPQEVKITIVKSQDE